MIITVPELIAIQKAAAISAANCCCNEGGGGNPNFDCTTICNNEYVSDCDGFFPYSCSYSINSLPNQLSPADIGIGTGGEFPNGAYGNICDELITCVPIGFPLSGSIPIINGTTPITEGNVCSEGSVITGFSYQYGQIGPTLPILGQFVSGIPYLSSTFTPGSLDGQSHCCDTSPFQPVSNGVEMADAPNDPAFNSVWDVVGACQGPTYRTWVVGFEFSCTGSPPRYVGNLSVGYAYVGVFTVQSISPQANLDTKSLCRFTCGIVSDSCDVAIESDGTATLTFSFNSGGAIIVVKGKCCGCEDD